MYLGSPKSIIESKQMALDTPLSLSEGEKPALLGKLRNDFLALRKEAGHYWPEKEFGR